MRSKSVHLYGCTIWYVERNGVDGELFSVLGRSASRNGAITCIGAFVGASARRISRVCRSSLASEAVALRNGCDSTFRLMILASELMTGHFCMNF